MRQEGGSGDIRCRSERIHSIVPAHAVRPSPVHGHISEEDALSYVLGYTIANDVTARDLQPKNGQWTIAKGFDTFMPLGPYISDEVDGSSLMITSRVNGETKQKSNTSNLIFSIPYLISYLSHVMTLLPGDIISTGTPGGISGMQLGDKVEIEIEGLGILENVIKAE